MDKKHFSTSTKGEHTSKNIIDTYLKSCCQNLKIVVVKFQLLIRNPVDVEEPVHAGEGCCEFRNELYTKKLTNTMINVAVLPGANKTDWLIFHQLK
jgi:hypothetical protein